MAGQERMTTEEVVRKVLVDEHADVSRESLELLVRELMEVEVRLVGAELGERRPEDRADGGLLARVSRSSACSWRSQTPILA